MQQTAGKNKIAEAICFFESQMASYDVCSLQTFHKELTYGDRIILEFLSKLHVMQNSVLSSKQYILRTSMY